MAEKRIFAGKKNIGAETREKLLNAAEKLFIERGFDGCSVSDIARRSKTAKGHLYYYFKNKESLFDAVLDRHLTAQRLALAEAAAASGNMREKVHSTLDAYVNFIEKNPGFPKLIQREICSGSKSVRKISAGMAPVHAWGASVFEEILPPDGPVSARHFFFSIYSMTLNYYTYEGMLGRLWGTNASSESARAERRAHLHAVADIIIDRLAGGEALPEAVASKGGKIR